MADFDESVYQFLEAYKLMPSDDGRRTDSVITTILNDNKRNYEAWLKCPKLLKDKYNGKIPDKILDIAATDPNFTDAEAFKADMEYEKRTNPYSVVPDALREHPMYEPLCTCGAKFTAAHVAVMKLMSEMYARNHYSYENAQKVAAEYAVRAALLEQIAKIKADKTLSEEQKLEQMSVLNMQHDLSRQRERETKRAERKNHPEKTIISWLMRVQTHRMSQSDATVEISNKLQQLIGSDKLILLAQEMAGPRYQKLVKPETKEFFAHTLKENGIDPNTMNQTQNQTASNRKQQNSAYVQQIRQMNYSR